MDIYTRKGDQGRTRLFTGEVISKDSSRVATYGAIDELQAQLGVCRASTNDTRTDEILLFIQQRLVQLAAEVASSPDRISSRAKAISAQDVAGLEQLIDSHTRLYGLPDGFIIPGNTRDSALLHVGRTLCRKMERLLVRLVEQEGGREILLRYVNRLSDLLFILAWGLEVRSLVKDNIQKLFGQQQEES